jgi:hypothetical protein
LTQKKHHGPNTHSLPILPAIIVAVIIIIIIIIIIA